MFCPIKVFSSIGWCRPVIMWFCIVVFLTTRYKYIISSMSFSWFTDRGYRQRILQLNLLISSDKLYRGFILKVLPLFCQSISRLPLDALSSQFLFLLARAMCKTS